MNERTENSLEMGFYKLEKDATLVGLGDGRRDDCVHDLVDFLLKLSNLIAFSIDLIQHLLGLLLVEVGDTLTDLGGEGIKGTLESHLRGHIGILLEVPLFHGLNIVSSLLALGDLVDLLLDTGFYGLQRIIIFGLKNSD